MLSLARLRLFLPLLKNCFALFYLLLNPLGILVKLVWKNGDGVDILRDIFPLFFGEVRGRIDLVELFPPVGFAIEMNDGYDDYYCDKDHRSQPESDTPVPQSNIYVFFLDSLDTVHPLLMLSYSFWMLGKLAC